MSLFKTTCPVRPEEQAWIEERLDWLTGQFGDGAMRGQVILPTDDFFPGVYQGSVADVRRVVDLVCTRMAVTPGSFVVELADLDGELELPGYRQTSGAAGEYRRDGGQGVVSVSMRQATAPMALVATIAHEFGHHRLIGEGRVEAGRRDNEPLTDLASVFFGFGIFAANASREFTATRRIDPAGQMLTGWRATRLGYLTEPMFGYALACWSVRRGDRDAVWQRHLDTNPKAFLRKGLRYLASSARAGRPPGR